jgi:hypothetical protein
MARITCAISGIRFDVSYLESVSIPHTVGYYHPVFTLSQRNLYDLYYKHTQNKLSPTDSYLLFCAFLHATKQVSWNSPASCNPNDAATKRLVQNNIAQLIEVYEKTSVIKHPSFRQPSFIVAYDNSHLQQVHNWIAAWNDNLVRWNVTRADRITQRNLAAIENLLSSKLTSGTPIDKLPAIVADWAVQAGEFPADKEAEYKKIIRSCFNSSKMFNTPLALIKEVREYCYSNIEAGSIHFHTLCDILNEGISRHVDYLGGSSLALGYTLLPSTDPRTKLAKEGELKTQAELVAIASKAPTEAPVRLDYSTDLDFLKAKLAYRIALNLQKHSTSPTDKKEFDL